MIKWIPTSRNSIALTFVLIITLGFFTGGLFDVLDYLIIKFIIVVGFLTLVFTGFYFAVQNKKNRFED